jgi:hypothetical protein
MSLELDLFPEAKPMDAFILNLIKFEAEIPAEHLEVLTYRNVMNLC